eukprot:1161842-Pelagomonas_calceolata.AAC.2
MHTTSVSARPALLAHHAVLPHTTGMSAHFLYTMQSSQRSIACQSWTAHFLHTMQSSLILPVCQPSLSSISCPAAASQLSILSKLQPQPGILHLSLDLSEPKCILSMHAAPRHSGATQGVVGGFFPWYDMPESADYNAEHHEITTKTGHSCTNKPNTPRIPWLFCKGRTEVRCTVHVLRTGQP